MTALVFILLICVFVKESTADTVSAEQYELTVKTSYGLIEGITLKSSTGKPVDAFLGVPFAASPTGDRRFAPPVEPDKWENTIETKSLPVSCMQGKLKQYTNRDYYFWENDAPESEDCLKLNIWVPRPRKTNVPVLVWIYGGCFQTGSSNIELYDGKTLSSEQEIIVVSFNYRLSALGFLYLDHRDAPGNVGLMDQAAALRWVQENIEHFGGDPNSVTLAGESAGGASVGFHLILSSSLNLFHRAIIESGTVITSWASKTKVAALQSSMDISRVLGCESSDPKSEEGKDEMLRCLRGKSSDEIKKALQSTHDDEIAPFPPVIDGSFLVDHPKSLMKQHKFCDVKPIIIGSTKEDGVISIPNFFRGKDFDDNSFYTAEDVRTVIQKLLGPNNSQSVDSAMKLYFKPDNQITPEILRQKLIEVLTDSFICNDNVVSNDFASAGNEVYKYRFSRRPSNSILPSWTGSVHGDEIPFVLGAPLNSSKGFDSADIDLSKHVMDYWGNFVRTGNPNSESNNLSYWPRYTLDTKLTLYLDVKPKSVKRDRFEECTFWQNPTP